MAKTDPWFRFWVRDYLTDIRVQMMPLVAQGAYLRLLSFQWQEGGLPGAEDDLPPLCSPTDDEREAFSMLEGERLDGGEFFFKICWPYLQDRFPVCPDGMRRNPRLEAERGYKTKLSKAGKAGGKASAEKRKAKRVRTTVQRLRNENPSIPDADADADADEEKKKSGQQKTVDVAHDSALGKDSILERWNVLASKHELPAIRALSPGRLSRCRARIREDPKFWDVLDSALTRRGTWAREHRFPTYDQATNAEKHLRLIEGVYDRPPEDEEEVHITREERRAFIKSERAAGETF